MSFIIIGNGGVLNSFVIAPGATVRHSYWWDGSPLGNDAWTACVLHPSIATRAPAAFIVANGMSATPTVTYYVDVRGDDGSQYAVYRLRIGQLT